MVASFDFLSLRPTPTFLKSIPSCETNEERLEEGIASLNAADGELLSALRANDGIVPLFSQWHPFDCK